MSREIVSATAKDPALRVEAVFRHQQQNIFRQTDRLFAGLMLFQWLACIVAAFWISPKTWTGLSSAVHPHLWAAVIIGGGIVSFPVILAFTRPGTPLTRHAVAVGQMLCSALLIHVTGGRIETHFHVFGSLAFLAFYRDWRVLISGSVVVALDHFLRGLYWPESVYGTVLASQWRWLEHGAWVIFEDVFLIKSCIKGEVEMWEIAERQAQLEASHATVEQNLLVLRESEARKAAILESALDCVITIDHCGRIVEFNPAAEATFGYSRAEVLGQELAEKLIPPTLRYAHRNDFANYLATGHGPGIGRRVEMTSMHASGREFPVELSISVVQLDGPPLFTAYLRDLTDRKRVEAEREELNHQLLETSRRVGMADVATSVLHNVGNVLNSVNVSAGLVISTLRQSPYQDVGRISKLLEEHADDLGSYLRVDPKGRQIPAYLAKLAGHFEEQHLQAGRELQSLDQQIEHIKQIISMQQNVARSRGLREPIVLKEVMEQALSINTAGLGRHQVEVVREYSEVPEVMIDKHQVLQILVNLISNAKHAMNQADGLRRLTLRVGMETSTGVVRLEVQDTGVGIKPEYLTRIFGQGFTTKSDGHGFGLHSGALAAKTMNGTLIAESDGEGCGAIFRLELPLHAVEAIA